MADGAVLTSEGAFFDEAERFTGLLRTVVAGADGASDAARDAAAAVDSAAAILDKYQEQPMLLDRHLPGFVDILMEAVRAKVVAARDTRDGAEEGKHEDRKEEASSTGDKGLHRVFQVVYLLCKTRGFKHIVRLFPHEIADLEPTVALMLAQDASDHDTWETRYGLLLWLSMLVLVPFDLATADSTMADGSGGSLIGNIVDTCKAYLADSGAVRTAAAVCLSRLLTRPDMDSSHLRSFLVWGDSVLAASDSSPSSAFLTTGVFFTLTECAKHGHREVLRDTLGIIWNRIVDLSASGKTSSALLRKLTVKLAQRTGLTFLPPKIVSWRYQRGQRSLLDNIGATGATDAIPGAGDSGKSGDVEDEEEEVDVPEQIDDTVEMLLTGLRDRDTVVRWSAAKGIGRITSRLPKDFAADVVEAVLQLLTEEEGDSAWHGSCLALAELARRGLLLPENLPLVVPFVVRALTYDVRRGAHSVGSHVRDGACYVCWAFARAYSPDVMRPHVLPLAQTMLTVACYDREVNCRRAASAAFQENVGRQGHDNFPHGIEVLTTADYFTLGNRSNAYMEIAPYVAQFEQYRYAFIDHLVDVKLRHWDLEIRNLSAGALRRLVQLDPRYFAEDVLPLLLSRSLDADLLVRHGACLAAAEVILALSQVPYCLFPAHVLKDARNLVPRIEKARLYRGKGGEYMRGAVCRFIECLSESLIVLTHRLALRLLKTLEECLGHPREAIQHAALNALRSLSRMHLSNGNHKDVKSKIVESFMTTVCTHHSPGMRRGLSLALGCLPKSVLMPSDHPDQLDRVIDTLLDKMAISKDVKARDAETRRNAVSGLGELCETVGRAVPGADGLNKSQVGRIFDALVKATRDYSTDNRGDVGSWVRTTAARAIEKLARVLLRDPTCDVDAPFTPGWVAHTPFGDGTIRSLKAQGQTCVVAFGKGTLGAAYFPYGTAFLARAAVASWQEQKESSDLDSDFAIASSGKREEFLVPDVLQQLKSAAEGDGAAQAALAGGFVQLEELWDESMSRRAVSALMRLAMEKLDLTRGVAGGVLSRMLHQADKLPGVPHHVALCDLIPPHAVGPGSSATADVLMAGDVVVAAADGTAEGEDESKGGDEIVTSTNVVNWSIPAQCFKRLVRALAFEEYVQELVAGLVTSVGGLSESVVKESSLALREWAIEQLRAKAFRKLSWLALALLGLLGWNFEAAKAAAQAEAAAAATGEASKAAAADAPSVLSKPEKRVISPTLRTLDILLANNIFQDLHEPRSPFAAELARVTQVRIMQCKDAVRVMAGINVFLGLIPYPANVRKVAMQALLDLLVHPYPKVRKLTAERLYERLLTYDNLFDDDKLDDALAVLTEQAWDSDVGGLRPLRDRLYKHLDVEKPAEERHVGPKQSGRGDGAAVDEHKHYSSLVNEVGY